MTPATVLKSTKTFKMDHVVYFNETNVVGGVVYFSNFVKWQGVTREEYFIRTVPQWKMILDAINHKEVNMITVEEHSYFLHHAFFGDRIKILLNTCNVRRFSFDMIFNMMNLESNTTIYEGMQRLAFDNFKGKFIEIPRPMLDSIKEYEIDPRDLKDSKLNKFFS
jgi:acyl-CoA thioesterase FadM